MGRNEHLYNKRHQRPSLTQRPCEHSGKVTFCESRRALSPAADLVGTLILDLWPQNCGE